MPTVTVVTPCYNAAAFIEETIDSVANQRFTDWEHVVVDDGSTDRSAALVARRAAATPRLRLIRQTNRGVCHARNAGARAADAESRYLLFLDADDRLRPDMLQTLVGHLDAHPEVGIAYCLLAPIHADGRPARPGPAPARYDATLLRLRPVPEQTHATPPLAVFSGAAIPSVSLVRRSAFEREGGFDPDLGQPEEDADLFSRIALRMPVHRLPVRLVEYRRHPNQASGDGDRMKAQRRKLIRKWQRMARSGEADEAACERLWRAWEGKVVPLIWLQAARNLAGERQVLRPALLLAGGGLRYVRHVALDLVARTARALRRGRAPSAPSGDTSALSSNRPAQTI
jgi:glycosyltransferase involved in cell wall biosynthesis